MNLKIGIVVTVVAITMLALSIHGYAISGFFSKAFDKSLAAGENYERNITIRRYYNLTVRFQKEGSTSYLSFDDNDSIIVLKAANGSVIKNVTGVKNGRHYVLSEQAEIAAISTASTLGISNYADVVNQLVNVSYLGTSAYVTITVNYAQASIAGYVVDDLTSEYVDGVNVYAFADGSNPQTAMAVVQNISTDGRYILAVDLNSSVALDVYAKDYDVA